MRDVDVRTALRALLEAEHAGDPSALIVDELQSGDGDTRVDLAVVNGSLNGFEIKSERDTLKRLPKQVESYGRCFDSMTLVSATKHLAAAMEAIPGWWGVIEAKQSKGAVTLRLRRKAKPNQGVAAAAIVRLLWKEEAKAVLAECGKDGLRGNGTRYAFWNLLVEHVPLEILREKVRARLKARGDWRAAPSPFRRDDSSRDIARSKRSRENRAWLLSGGFAHPQS